MKIQINILLSKICCSYTKSGIVHLVRGIIESSSIKIKVNFNAPYETGRAILVVTKGHFIPFTLTDAPFIIIPDKVPVEIISDILICLISGKVSDYIKVIKLGRRESLILKEMIFEKTDSEISTSLKINKKTVSSYKDNIKKKISANSRIDIFYAFSVFSSQKITLQRNQ